MKKTLLMLLGVLMSLPALARDFKYTYEEQELIYTVIDEDAKTVQTKAGSSTQAGNEVEGILIIPSIVKDGDTEYTVTQIGDYAFCNCDALNTLILPEGLEIIGKSAFEGCTVLENHDLPSTLMEICDNAYKNASITSVTLPEHLNKLGSGVFQGSNVVKAVLVADIDTLGDDLFANTPLNTVFLPLKLKSIGNQTFSGCENLDEILFPATLESIGNNAFANCGLKKLDLPNSVKTLGEGAFQHNIITVLTIGSGLEVIPQQAFYKNSSLLIVNFSEGLKEIKPEAFYWAHDDFKGISKVKLPSTLTTIGEGAFDYCKICELEIPDGIKSLPSRSCGNPSILTIGSGVTDIAADAFGFGNILRVKASTPPNVSAPFSNNYDKDALTVIVNNGCRNKYTSNSRWKNFENIIEESSSDITVYMTGDYPLAEEIRTTTGYMPSCVAKMKVVGPLTSNDLRIIRENIIAKTKRATFQNETSKTSLFSLPFFSCSLDRLNTN